MSVAAVAANHPNVGAGGPGLPERLVVPLAILVATAAAAGLCLAAGEHPALSWLGAGLIFQLGCWGLGIAVLAFLDPLGRPRLSDPGILFLLWAGAYLVHPSAVWYLGGRIPFADALTADTAATLFFLHGLFLLAFLAAYLPLRGLVRWPTGGVQIRQLPSGLILFLLPFALLAVTVLLRVAAGGSWLPEKNYGEEWLEGQAHLQATRASGGAAYFVEQLLSKTWFYPVLAQGVGAGLLFAHAVRSRRGRGRVFLALAAGCLVMLLFSNRPRTEVLIGVGIAFIVTDFLVGPLKWRNLGLVALAGLVLFEAWGAFRQYRDLPFDVAVSEAVGSYASERADGVTPMGEFRSMLGKEAMALHLFRESEGWTYLGHEALALLPSQLCPDKLTWLSTSDRLSMEFLGPLADAGGGVAGTSVGNGYRFAGPAGVAVMAALLGAVVGGVRRWVTRGWAPGGRPPVLLQLALVAGVFGWTFHLLRSDLVTFLGCLLYNLILPWLLLRLVLPAQGAWLRPLQRFVVVTDYGTPPQPGGAPRC